jgi:hypothetical protein
MVIKHQCLFLKKKVCIGCALFLKKNVSQKQCWNSQEIIWPSNLLIMSILHMFVPVTNQNNDFQCHMSWSFIVFSE